MFKAKNKSHSSMLAAFECCKAFDFLALGVLFKPVACKDFSETVIPFLQTKNVKKHFLPPQDPYFLNCIKSTGQM